jgi:hypothetical protein
MQSPFETAPDAAAIPITFRHQDDLERDRPGTPRTGRQFAAANDFTASPANA